MSPENVEVVRRFTEDFNAFMRGDFSSQALLEAFDSEIEVEWHGEQTYPDVPQHLQGARALIEFFEESRGEWPGLVQEPLELLAAPGDRVVALIRQSGRGRQSGVPILLHFFEIVALRDGKLCRIEYFRHRSDAMEAAGLSG